MAGEYKQGPTLSTIQRVSDGAWIPIDQGNRDYREYLDWVGKGNVPLPPDPVPETPVPAKTISAEDLAGLLRQKFPLQILQSDLDALKK